MAEKSSVFDMIGPVMIGPSSSHTAGVVRIGRVAYRIFGNTPETVTITFYNSFARTYEGHGSDRAILAGLMNFKTDDARIKQALDLAKELGIEYKFKSIGNASILHPNTLKVDTIINGKPMTVTGASLGGGVIRIKDINGFDSNFTASAHTLIVEATDSPGSISYITSIISGDKCNIATMTVSRRGKNAIACLVIEMDHQLKKITLEYLKELHWIHSVLYIPNIDI